MEIVGFLIIFPLIVAALLLLIRSETLRTVIVLGGAVIIMLATLLLAVGHLMGPTVYLGLAETGETLALLVLVVDVACSVFVIVKAVRDARMFAVFLAGSQLAILMLFEFLVPREVLTVNHLYIDQFSVIMALVIGIIGSGICIYALGYMRDFQEHERAHGKPDRRPVFFALMFLFLSAMFLIVFSNDLTWLFCGWEVTTVCSFALIGYTRTKEAVDNSYRQITMNLVGSLAFVIALVILGSADVPILELDKLIASGSLGLFAFPIMLLSITGFTKAAQMPFQSWLLGAMVAPTPTSALLHSSTMVKAGVFILIKLAPCFCGSLNGLMVSIVGGLTFLLCSAVAISQTNAKRVLAYSTVANLGLIVVCAGLGTPEAVWAAIFLLIFHAVAKSLLFMCVGTAEHHVGSRDIEDMDAIFHRMPRIALLMALGMLCMFIAPFGMLIAKWATIVSIVNSGNTILVFTLAFGSALTFIFWAKWLGKVLAIAHSDENQEMTVHRTEWGGLGLMAALIVCCSVLFPLISSLVVIPYLSTMASGVLHGQQQIWNDISPAISQDNLLIMVIIVVVLLAALTVQFIRKSGTPKSNRHAAIYLSGVGLDFEKRTFRNSLSQETEATQRNWYLGSWFSEENMLPFAHIVTAAVLVVFFFGAYLGIGGLL